MKFRVALVSFIVVTIVVAIICYQFELNFGWLLLPLIAFKSLIIYGSSVIQSNFYLNAHNSADTSEKKIAITFDDGPHPQFTSQVLDVLNEYQARSTFFIIGKNIIGNESVLKDIHNKGHLIGNHSFSHSFFIDFKSKNGFIEEIDKTANAVEGIIGKSPRLFRPPYGVTTPNIASAVKEKKLSVIGWNIRSFDTKGDKEEVILNRIKKQLNPGSILLLHDTSEKSISVLKQTLSFAQKNGFKFVGVDELLNIQAYE